jgi:hypothetical protein
VAVAVVHREAAESVPIGNTPAVEWIDDDIDAEVTGLLTAHPELTATFTPKGCPARREVPGGCCGGARVELVQARSRGGVQGAA